MFRSLDASWLDLKLGVRMLWKYPGLSLIGGLAMAVAIAFGTATFAFFHSQLDSTLPLPEGDRIVALENWDTKKNNEERRAADDLSLWRRELKTVQEIGAFRNVGRNLIVTGRAIEPIRIAEISAAGFGVARTAPVLGRPILPSDEAPEAEPVLLIGYDVWQSRFAGDPAVIGRAVRIGATPHTIIGVMPAGFAFPMNHNYWTPLRIEIAHHPPGAGPAIFIFGRLAPGETMASAQAELTPIGERRSAEYPATHEHLRPRVLPYTYTLLDIQDVTMWQVAVMQGMISMLLVIVAVNVGILIYARTATRQGEIAIRGALGASRLRIVGQLFVEALVLSVAAGAVGVMIARIALTQGNAIMQSEFGRMPFWLDDGIPPVALLYAAAVSVFAAIVAGILPALQATRHRAAGTLRELGGSTGIRLGATWTVLIVAQVALAVAGLPVIVSEGWREVRQATSAPTFRMEEYMAVRLSLDLEDPPPGVRPDAHRTQVRARLARLHSQMASRIEGDPAVIDVTSAFAIPGAEPIARIRTERTGGGEGLEHEVRVNRIAEDFFDAFDAAVLTGRVPTVADRDAVLVNRTFARRIFGDAEALGRRIQYVPSEDASGERWFEVIGIVEDLYTNSLSPEIVSSEIYHPLQAADAVDATFILRMRGGEPAALGDRLRQIATDVEPDVRVGARPMTLVYQQDKLALRLVTGVLGAIILSVLLLSSAGIYALVSFTVSRRRKEIGVRAALGAEPGRLLRSVFARAAGQIALGLVIGVVTIAVLDTLSDGSLLGGKGKILLPAISLMMVTAGVLAVVGPARRALRIQPIEALREE
jgi:putative ABC transport system permease protein